MLSSNRTVRIRDQCHLPNLGHTDRTWQSSSRKGHRWKSTLTFGIYYDGTMPRRGVISKDDKGQNCPKNNTIYWISKWTKRETSSLLLQRSVFDGGRDGIHGVGDRGLGGRASILALLRRDDSGELCVEVCPRRWPEASLCGDLWGSALLPLFWGLI